MLEMHRNIYQNVAIIIYGQKFLFLVELHDRGLAEMKSKITGLATIETFETTLFNNLGSQINGKTMSLHINPFILIRPGGSPGHGTP